MSKKHGSEDDNLRISIKRRKLWDISPRFHCALIGTCVPVKELRLVSKRCRIDLAEDFSDYDFHSMFVNMADIPSPALRLLQKVMDRRYASAIRCFAKARSVAELTEIWNDFLQKGKIDGGFWALMGHPLLTPEMACQAHGDLHMLSHSAIHHHQSSLQHISDLKNRIVGLDHQLSHSKARWRAIEQERDSALEKLKHQIHQTKDLENQFDMATKRLEALENGQEMKRIKARFSELLAENEYLSSRVSSLEAEYDCYQRQLDNSKEKQLALTRSMASLKRQYELAKQEIAATKSRQAIKPCDGQEMPLNQFDLCGRCVLVVGGRTGQCEHYRELIERHNGRFIHHDGGREDSRQRLGAILPQADAVLCPLDSISHDAIKRVKRFCEQHTKRLVFVPRSSLAAFTEGLKAVAV